MLGANDSLPKQTENNHNKTNHHHHQETQGHSVLLSIGYGIGVAHKPEETFQISYLSEDQSILPEPRGPCVLTPSQNSLNQTDMFNLNNDLKAFLNISNRNIRNCLQLTFIWFFFFSKQNNLGTHKILQVPPILECYLLL